MVVRDVAGNCHGATLGSGAYNSETVWKLAPQFGRQGRDNSAARTSLLRANCRLSGQVRNSFQRWGQPGQQQGRRIPSLSSVRTRSTCCLLVSGLLTEMTQQIHSLRASGVIFSHFARAAGSEMRTFRKSAGTACTAPRETALLVMDFSLYPTGVVLIRVVG